MNKAGIYLSLSVVGLVMPYTQFIPFLLENGLNIVLFFEQLFANRIGGFFGWDVIVSSLVLFFFVFTESRRLNIARPWIPVVCTLSVGVSLGLPMFLYMREKRLQQLA